MQLCQTASFLSPPSYPWSPVQYGSRLSLCTIRSCGLCLYDINLGATTTTILSTRGVTIPIGLVSSAMDSIRRHGVLFKPVPILTSDLKSEFLWQSSLSCTEPTDPPETTSYAWDISHTLTTMYHPYCHSPGALTEYLKDKLCCQWAKRLSHSLPAQVEPNVLLGHNKYQDWLQPQRKPVKTSCQLGIITGHPQVIVVVLCLQTMLKFYDLQSGTLVWVRFGLNLNWTLLNLNHGSVHGSGD